MRIRLFALFLVPLLCFAGGTISPQRDPLGFIAGPNGQFIGNGAGLTNIPGASAGWTGNANQFAVANGTTNIKSGATVTNLISYSSGADPLTLHTPGGEGASANIQFKNSGTNLSSVFFIEGFGVGVGNFDLSDVAYLDTSGNFMLPQGAFSGSGASLTALPAGQLTGTIPWAVVANSPTITTNAGTLTGLQVGNGGRGTTNATSDTTATLGALLASRIAYSTNGIGGEAIDFNPTKHSFNMSSNVVFTGVTDKDSSGTNYDEAIYFLRNTNTSAATVAFSGSWLFAGASTNNWSTTGNVAPTNGQSGAFTNTVPPGNMRVFIITHQPGQWTNIFSN